MAGERLELLVTLQGRVVQSIVLAQGVLTIGRSPDADISLPHPQVSRRHAEIRVTAESTILTDTASSNGTLLNGERLPPDQPHALNQGARIEIGPFELLVRDEPVASADEAVAHDALPDLVDGAAIELEPPDLPLARVSAPPRDSHPLSPLEGPQSTYLNHLPGIYQDNDFLGRFLLIFESVWEPLEQRQEHIHRYFSPATAPQSFLPWIASWFDLRPEAHWPESRVRELIGEVVDLYQWRGTAYGLARVIEVVTGGSAQIRDDATSPFVFNVRVTLPESSGTDEEQLHRLICAHKPAHTGYILEVVTG